MDPDFWHQRWKYQNIGFHGKNANPLLTRHFRELSLEKESRIFVPLCGKTLDISWLLSNGYRIAGAELSRLAIEQLFSELNLKPAVSTTGPVDHYSSEKIDIYAGDIFHLTEKTLGPVDAIYDRAALVALPAEMRKRYTSHLLQITNHAPQLLITYDYDQQMMEGPPFSVSPEEVHDHYDSSYKVTRLASTAIPGGLKRKAAANEDAWLLQ